MKTKLILALIIIFASFLRLFALNKIPSGVYLDEASLGYNAYSLIKTGADEYGKNWPIFFRSFSTFQSPLYTYLTTLPVYLFDLNIFSTRLISALSGILTIVFTFYLIYWSKKESMKFALLATFVLSLCPWAIFMSRAALEANLALTLIILSLAFLILSFRNQAFLIPSSIILAISTYAYHGERVFSNIFFILFLLIFKSVFLKNKKILLLSLIIFFSLQTPQIILSTTQGSLTRLNSQGYLQEESFQKYGGDYKKITFGREFFVLKEFSSQYIAFFSPRNLFFDPESQLFRSIPDLSVFYNWMIIPFLFGIVKLYSQRSEKFSKLLTLVTLVGAIPGALGRDPFYTLRVLPTLWGLSLIISLGIYSIGEKIKFFYIKIGLSLIILFLSLTSLITSYFILLKYERSESYGYPFIEISQLSEKMKDTNFIVDTKSYDVPYILLAFYKKYDPYLMQRQIPKKILDNYYTNLTFNRFRQVDNVKVKEIQFGVDTCQDEIIITDIGTLSDFQVNDHKLTLEFKFKDQIGNIILKGYRTHPKAKCN